MAESLANLKRKLMEASDKVNPSPSTRAKYVWDILQAHPELTKWDLVCFAAELLGNVSIALPFLEPDAKSLNKLVYTAHYMDPTNDTGSGIKLNNSSNDSSRSEKENSLGTNPKDSGTEHSGNIFE